ncbi:glycerophosphoryl diester phosphodiesterase [Pseudoclavibacter endophyticus]|nr:glycerophosphoryl diester phosphodiesterase [Pseudoclavibacter endophyticus]
MQPTANPHGRTAFPGEHPALIGHRGAPAYRPEHTEAAYRLAIAQGADYVEPDIVPTRDGVLMVRHEPLLDHTTDVLRFDEFASRRRTVDLGGFRAEGLFTPDFDWAELRRLRAIEPMPGLRAASAAHDRQQGVLRLRDLVELVGEAREAAGDGARVCRLVIELKHTDVFAAAGLDLIDLLERELDGLWESPALEGVVWESFERDALRRLRAGAAPGAVVALMAERGGPHDVPGSTYADELTPAGLDALAGWADGISVSTPLLGVRDASTAADPVEGRALVGTAHERGLQVATYTLRPEDRFLPDALAGRPEEHWRGILRTGVDAVFADAPDRVRALIDAEF